MRMTTTTTANGRKTKTTAKQRAEYSARASVFKALSDPARVEIVHVLRRGPIDSTTAIVDALEGRLSQPTISHHLQSLERAGIVVRMKIGVFSTYQLAAERMAEIASWLAPTPSA